MVMKSADRDEAGKVWVCVREGETCHGGDGADSRREHCVLV